MGYDDDVREQALQLYLEGNSLRSIGHILSVHHVSVSNWINAHQRSSTLINAHAYHLPKRVDDTTPTHTVEVDELFTYVGKKRSVSIVCLCSDGGGS